MCTEFFEWKPVTLAQAIGPALFTIIAPGFTEEVSSQTPLASLCMPCSALSELPLSPAPQALMSLAVYGSHDDLRHRSSAGHISWCHRVQQHETARVCAGHLPCSHAAPPQGQPGGLPAQCGCICCIRPDASHHLCRLPPGAPFPVYFPMHGVCATSAYARVP